MTFSSSLRAQRSNPESKSWIATSKVTLLLAMTARVSACKADTPQASHQNCQFVWIAFEENMNKAKLSDGIDKLYFAEVASMNIDVLLEKGCCKYKDTCPAAVMD